MTQRYVYLSLSAFECPIRLLDQARLEEIRGDMVETGTAAEKNPNG